MNTVIKIKKLEINMRTNPSRLPIGMGIFGETHKNTTSGSVHSLEWSEPLLDGRRVSFKDAEKAVEALGDGWRLPTLKELQSIVDYDRHNPAIDTDKFPNTKSEPFWTNSPCAWNKSARWVVGFYGGVVGGNYDGGTACVRACRASQ